MSTYRHTGARTRSHHRAPRKLTPPRMSPAVFSAVAAIGALIAHSAGVI